MQTFQTMLHSVCILNQHVLFNGHANNIVDNVIMQYRSIYA